MEIIIHRVNTITKLQQVQSKYGCEIDLRTNGSEIVLNHDPYVSGVRFSDFLENYKHGTLILNIKEAGIENDVLSKVKEYGLMNYFLLDVEFPYIYRASRQGERAIAIRYSEDEPIELAKNYINKIDWIWIDTNTKLPLNREVVSVMENFKTCLVCPERWNRPNDIPIYKEAMKNLNFSPNAVMTALEYVHLWEK